MMNWKDPEQVKEYFRQYRETHREQIRATNREYARRYHAEHQEETKAYKKQYRLAHHEAALAKDKEMYQKHQQNIRVRARQRNRLTKEEVIAVYGGECACCGETTLEFLAIDHINGNGYQHRQSIKRSGNPFYHWLKLQGYPLGYRVLCHNCNQSLGHYGYCPHQQIVTPAFAAALAGGWSG